MIDSSTKESFELGGTSYMNISFWMGYKYIDGTIKFSIRFNLTIVSWQNNGYIAGVNAFPVPRTNRPIELYIGSDTTPTTLTIIGTGTNGGYLANFSGSAINSNRGEIYGTNISYNIMD